MRSVTLRRTAPDPLAEGRDVHHVRVLRVEADAVDASLRRDALDALPGFPAVFGAEESVRPDRHVHDVGVLRVKRDREDVDEATDLRVEILVGHLMLPCLSAVGRDVYSAAALDRDVGRGDPDLLRILRMNRELARPRDVQVFGEFGPGFAAVGRFPEPARDVEVHVLAVAGYEAVEAAVGSEPDEVKILVSRSADSLRLSDPRFPAVGRFVDAVAPTD